LAIAVVILGGLILAQTRRWLEKIDLFIIPRITFVVIFLIPLLRSSLGIQQVVIFPVAAALIAIAVTTYIISIDL
jgi:serine/threonine-protein kinase